MAVQGSKRVRSPWRNRPIVDDGVNVVQSREFPLVIRERADDVKYTIRVGDTLMKLAAKIYGDTLDWHVISDRNNIAFPLDIQPGDKIIVPSATTRALAFRG